MKQQLNHSLKACLMLSALREKMKLRRSFWLETFQLESQFLSLADSDLLRNPGEASRHHLFSKVKEESKQALIRALSSDALRQKLRRQEQDAAAHNINAVSWLSPYYPDRLLHISSYPLVLYYRGNLPLQALSQMNAVTVVGTRKPSYYGRQVVQQMTADWCKKGLICVSGLARGIDGLAHQTAVEKDAPTIAVLANGLDIVYPPEHLKLYEQLLKKGMALSEHPPGQKPLRQHFPTRNRILSGLCQAVVVIEAAEKSGSLITAEFAADQGRDVFAVPGTIFSAGSRGCNLLIKDGAAMLLSPDDLYTVYELSESDSLIGSEEAKAAVPFIKSFSQQQLDSEIPVNQQQPDSETPVNQRQLAFETVIGRQQPDSERSVSQRQPDSDQQGGCNRFKTDSDHDMSAIKDVLRACPLTISTICAETGLSPSKCAILLTQMELSGQVILERGHYSLTE